MSDDIAWHAASLRCQRHFRRVHSVDAILVGYEQVIATLGKAR